MRPSSMARLVAALACAGTAWAQQAPNAQPPAAPNDVRTTFRAGEALPAPAAPDPGQAPAVALSTEPIDPFMLTREAGPFMIMAQTFRGPDAARYAQALVMELRQVHRLPAYIFFQKIQPGGSNIAGVPPTAPQQIVAGRVVPPEKYRVYDEAAVLVGNFPTADDAQKYLKSVKKIKPQCLAKIPQLYQTKHKGLEGAFFCVNPYIPAQQLFQRPVDPLIKRLNAGPNTIFSCPGPYTLQVAEFAGRSTFKVNDPKFEKADLSKSPLATAADDAVRLADEFNKNDALRKAGYQAYVFHDRASSKVTIGSFRASNDPNAMPVQRALLNMTMDMGQKKITETPVIFSPKLIMVPKS